MWDMGPQSIESLKPRNPGYFLLQVSLYSLGTSLLVHIRCGTSYTCMTTRTREVNM